MDDVRQYVNYELRNWLTKKIGQEMWEGMDNFGPTLYTTLLETALDEDVSDATAQFQNYINRLQGFTETLLKEAMMCAYRRGLTHGFQQGVEAECKRRDEN